MKSDLTHISTGPDSGEYSTLPRDYKGFTIEKETEPWAIKFGGYVRFYPSDGIDCDWTGDGWRSNVDNARTVQEAMEEIDERIIDKL